MNNNPYNLVEIGLFHDGDFLKIKETLTRLGIPSYKDEKTLYQSCHILHKRGKFYIVHFKELFKLDGRFSTLNQEDIARRNSIIQLLLDWNLCELITEVDLKETGFSRVKIIKHAEKPDWNLKAKYSIGND